MAARRSFKWPLFGCDADTDVDDDGTLTTEGGIDFDRVLDLGLSDMDRDLGRGAKEEGSNLVRYPIFHGIPQS